MKRKVKMSHQRLTYSSLSKYHQSPDFSWRHKIDRIFKHAKAAMFFHRDCPPTTTRKFAVCIIEQ
jgi:hypothetical protein